jgi:hypothetical protein
MKTGYKVYMRYIWQYCCGEKVLGTVYSGHGEPTIESAKATAQAHLSVDGWDTWDNICVIDKAGIKGNKIFTQHELEIIEAEKGRV